MHCLQIMTPCSIDVYGSAPDNSGMHIDVSMSKLDVCVSPATITSISRIVSNLQLSRVCLLTALQLQYSLFSFILSTSLVLHSTFTCNSNIYDFNIYIMILIFFDFYIYSMILIFLIFMILLFLYIFDFNIYKSFVFTRL